MDAVLKPTTHAKKKHCYSDSKCFVPKNVVLLFFSGYKTRFALKKVPVLLLLLLLVSSKQLAGLLVGW